jgi:hypothetical protein
MSLSSVHCRSFCSRNVQCVRWSLVQPRFNACTQFWCSSTRFAASHPKHTPNSVRRSITCWASDVVSQSIKCSKSLSMYVATMVAILGIAGAQITAGNLPTVLWRCGSSAGMRTTESLQVGRKCSREIYSPQELVKVVAYDQHFAHKMLVVCNILRTSVSAHMNARHCEEELVNGRGPVRLTCERSCVLPCALLSAALAALCNHLHHGRLTNHYTSSGAN